MKEQVIEVLRDRSAKPHEKFNKAMALYMRHKEANPVLVRNYNQVGNSPEALKNLCYDLQQLYGVSDSELRGKARVVETKPKPDAITNKDINDLLKEDLEKLDYHDALKPLAAKVAEETGNAPENQKKKALIEFILEERRKKSIPNKNENPFENSGEDAKTGLKLRDEFPFLYEDDCPDKLKILVADKMTAYKKVLESREELFKNEDGQTLSEEEILEQCKSAVENLELNELIYKELNHYKEHGEILGEHPLFADEVLKREVAELSDKDAHQAYRNLATYISREKKNLEKAKSDESKAKIQGKIDEFQTRRKLISDKLGLDEK